MSTTPAPEGRSRFGGFESVPIAVTVRVGLARVSVAKLAELAPGDVLTLDRDVGAPFDLIAGDVLLGQVEPVVSDDVVVFKLVSCAECDDERTP